jgi:hypothetical protein
MSTLQSGTKYLNHSLLGPNNDEKWYYYNELNISGTSPNRTFSVDLYASDSSDLSVATLIGTKNIKTGYLTLNSSASSLQERDRRQIQQKTKNSVTYWVNKMGSAGLPALSDSEKTSLGIASGNTNQDNNGTVGAAATTGGNNDEIEFNFDDIVLNLQGRKFRKKYEDLFYPVGLGANKQDRIRFEQIYSEGTKIGGIDLQGKVFQRKQKRINGSVTLPIVTGIADKNEVDWQGASLNPLQALGASGALSLFEAAGNSGSIADAFSNAGSAINEAAARAKGTVGSDVKQAINIYLAQKAVGAQGLLSKATGAILNPNLEMLFSGPSLRSFDFTFKLSPRDANEATQVRKIIRFFKQGMSVKTSSSNVFLKAPNIFTIRYQTFNTNGEEILHPSLNIIKECALKSCDVQYTPDGTYMTYEDPYRTMTSYQLTLSFGELDPIYDSDYTELDNDQDQVIGY